jgi:hypothetical protein
MRRSYETWKKAAACRVGIAQLNTSLTSAWSPRTLINEYCTTKGTISQHKSSDLEQRDLPLTVLAASRAPSWCTPGSAPSRTAGDPQPLVLPTSGRSTRSSHGRHVRGSRSGAGRQDRKTKTSRSEFAVRNAVSASNSRPRCRSWGCRWTCVLSAIISLS